MNRTIQVQEKKRIGIYSGSFNPIHIGHTSLAQYLVDNDIVDEVWFVVSPCNPLKNQSELLDEFIRLDMVVEAIQGVSAFKASDIEFNMPVPSYSIDTLNELSSLYPHYQFHLIIGSDNALVFDKWKNYEEILQNYPILVYPRRGFDFSTVSTLYPQMRILESPFYDISSTEIRNLIRNKIDFSSLLAPSVYIYIAENELYMF